jgi:predicted nucleic acid-binding protein
MRFLSSEIDLAIMRAHVSLWSALSAQGAPIGVHDFWIAAACIA